MKKYMYTIYQVKVSERFSFMGWETANRHGWSFDPYCAMWSGNDEAADDYDLLNYLYEVFNVDRPSGFRGHSMSLGDIIRIWGEDDNVKYYYCDSFGWEDITDIIKKTA